MNFVPRLLAAITFFIAATAAHADQKEDTFYILLDNLPDNPVLQESLQNSLIDMLLSDALGRGLGLADAIVLRADRSVPSWNEDVVTSRNLPPEQLRKELLERLPKAPDGASNSRLMRLIQTTPINCSMAETVTVYVISNFVSATTLDADGAHLETAPSVSLSGCKLVWIGATLGSPELALRDVQHVDALLANLSAHLGASDHVVLR